MRSRAILAFIFVGWLPSYAIASPVGKWNACVDNEYNYYVEDRFITGLEGVSWNKDVFDYSLKTYALTYCPTKDALVINLGPKNESTSEARRLIVEMIASAQKENFGDVQKRLQRAGYVVERVSVSDDSCLCKRRK